MPRRLALSTAVLWLAAGLWAGRLGAIEVWISSPRSSVPAFGTVEVASTVVSDHPVTAVELRVDGRLVRRLVEPPFNWSVEVGQENESHRFEVTAWDVTGESARAVVETPRVRIDEQVDVELQQIYVTATRGGEPVGDLPRAAFSVMDTGVAQELVTFERGDVPLTALLLIDASDSMRGRRLQVAAASALSFIEGMQTLDEAMLLLFSERVLHATPFTGFREVLGAGLDRVEGKGGTALCDHLYLSLKLLDERQGRRVLVVLSDGIDSASILGMQEVLWAARRSQALIYWLQLGAGGRGVKVSSPWRNADGYREELETLEKLVRQSGGEIIGLQGIEQAGYAFAAILDQLRGQYVLGYYPSEAANDGSWRKVKVRVPGNVKLRYRAGYVDY